MTGHYKPMTKSGFSEALWRVECGTGEDGEGAVRVLEFTAGGEHLAVRQPGRGVAGAGVVQVPGEQPRVAGRIVEPRDAVGAIRAFPGCQQNLAAEQQRQR